ncbi:MAG: ornithine cyclodeaminase family protein [Alphaproteobacteria bacterium]|nr:ornithine cyclodeaminase family protein [Alphaproteobacteria bacterium]MBU1515196.1 ornithine cyclodeaminase family protein [Alphaproteobacteria bacterium]MBU2092326.1 ornithine cyclodeaminase family protein [Alphaproteobacteria bacterium]MBU2152920.1 ornithine cyclodeaminase family protein [Alphaproteobacteria bacterium]MBU2305751.1 ornithine cyclodeaminase family protein [Alphaproteobacteria bacterium]
MRSFNKEAILSAIDPDQAIETIAQAFRDHSAGKVQSIAVGHLRFDRPSGDVHVKGAHIDGRQLFAIKMASSFYDNPAQGLPSSNGLMLVFNARTGEPLGMLSDEGALTDLRTAVAGAIAARLIAPAGMRTLGVIGAGTQAGLQARWIARSTGASRIRIWARSMARAQSLASQLQAEGQSAEAVEDLATLCREADLIVTTTPARAPVIGAETARPGLRIVAVGADAAGKRELAPELVSAADLLLVDSRSQCAAYGDSAGAVLGTRMIEIGEALATAIGPTLAPDDMAIADLTGIGAQDAAIAELAWRSLTS